MSYTETEDFDLEDIEFVKLYGPLFASAEKVEAAVARLQEDDILSELDGRLGQVWRLYEEARDESDDERFEIEWDDDTFEEVSRELNTFSATGRWTELLNTKMGQLDEDGMVAHFERHLNLILSRMNDAFDMFDMVEHRVPDAAEAVQERRAKFTEQVVETFNELLETVGSPERWESTT